MRDRKATAEDISNKLRKELQAASYSFVVLQYDGTLKTISAAEVVKFGAGETVIMLS